MWGNRKVHVVNLYQGQAVILFTCVADGSTCTCCWPLSRSGNHSVHLCGAEESTCSWLLSWPGNHSVHLCGENKVYVVDFYQGQAIILFACVGQRKVHVVDLYWGQAVCSSVRGTLFEIICMKCQNPFSGGKKKKIFWVLSIKNTLLRSDRLVILTHFRQNKLVHTIYWKSQISILGMSGYVI